MFISWRNSLQMQASLMDFDKCKRGMRQGLTSQPREEALTHTCQKGRHFLPLLKRQGMAWE